MVLSDHLAYSGLEVVDVLLPRLVHHFSYFVLALMKGFDSFSWRCKFLPWAAEPRIVEIDLLEGHFAVRVLL